MTTMHFPNFAVSIEEQGEWVYPPGPESDPDWKYIDKKGHGHFYEDGYPTLKWVQLPCTMGHGSDCTAEGYWRCRKCKEEISPGTRLAQPFYVAGVTTYTLVREAADGTHKYMFGEDQWKSLMAAFDDAIEGTLAAYDVEIRLGR